MEKRIFDLLKKCFVRVKVDYIVEQGISGIWSYRKWDSGIAECWGVISLNVTEWHTWGSGYASSIGGKTRFPFTFIEPPQFNIEYQHNSRDAWIISCTNPTADETPSMQLLRFGSVGNNGIHKVFFNAKGKWKNATKSGGGSGTL